jgi:hypothetical protein
MVPRNDPQVIFYLGPAGDAKTRQALRTVAANPRSLVVTLNEDPYSFRLSYADAFECSCREQVTPLHGVQHVRIAGCSNWQREVFSERNFDRIFFKDLPDLFRQEEDALELTLSLSRLAVLKSADIVVTLDFSNTDEIIAWEGALPFQWGGQDNAIGFWLNVHGAPLRYLRMSALRVLKPKPTHNTHSHTAINPA